MVKSEKRSMNELSADGTLQPPKIPPRMKKKGPVLPEKPLRMRTTAHSSPREPLQPTVLSSSNIARPQREVLVAASTARDRPAAAEKRQREPAKLLVSSPADRPRKYGSLPVLLIPPHPVSYGLWRQREGGTVRQPVVQYLSVFEPRSGSVVRSGSLTSQGSYSSDSETFPKSVLKKQKRSTNKEAAGSCRKIEHKKNVTFNAFATIQLMQE